MSPAQLTAAFAAAPFLLLTLTWLAGLALLAIMERR